MNEEFGVLIRFGIAGLIVAVIYVVLFFILQRMGIPNFISNSAAFLIAVFMQYVLQARWTFRYNLIDRQQGFRFAATIGLGFVYSSLVVVLISPVLGLGPVISASIAAVTLPVINFIAFRLWVFGAANQR